MFSVDSWALSYESRVGRVPLEGAHVAFKAVEEQSVPPPLSPSLPHAVMGSLERGVALRRARVSCSPHMIHLHQQAARHMNYLLCTVTWRKN